MTDRNSKIWNIFFAEVVASFLFAIFTPGLLLISSSVLYALSKKLNELTDLNELGIKTIATYLSVWFCFWLWLHERNKTQEN